MIRIFNKSISIVLAIAMVFSVAIGLFAIPASTNAMPRIENKLLLDTNPQNGYEGDYVIAYNPLQNKNVSVTTGVISDQMKTVDFSLNNKADTNSALPYKVEFKQRITASEAKKAFSADAKAYSLNDIITLNTTYSVGDNRTFKIVPDLNDGWIEDVEFTLAAVGEHCYIWIINNEEYALTAAQAADMANEYDEVIHDAMLESFGEFIDFDESGMLNILVYDIQDGFGYTTNGYTCGYFNYADPEDNNAAMIHIDTYPTIHWNDEMNWQEAYSTIVHELQHLINFSQYLSNTESPEEENSVMATWLNECCSLAAEEMVYPNSVASYRLEKFATTDNPYTSGASLYNWNEQIINYSMMYLFGQYIRMQTGGYSAFKNMLEVYAKDASPSEAKAVEASVQGSALEGFSLSEVVLAYRIAMLTNEVKAYNGIYGFCGNDTFDSIPAMTYTSSQTPKIYGGGAIVIETKNGIFNPPKNASADLQFVGITFADEPIITSEPIIEPTLEVTLQPTAEPTLEITAEPTLEATVLPTIDATIAPTAEPTIDSTVMPTAEVTAEPTAEVTVEPTIEPTLLPLVNTFMAYLSVDRESIIAETNMNFTVSIAAPVSAPLTNIELYIETNPEYFTIKNITLNPEYNDIFYVLSEEGDIRIALKENSVFNPLFVIDDILTVELNSKAINEAEIVSNIIFANNSIVESENENAPEFMPVNTSVRIVNAVNDAGDYIIDYENKLIRNVPCNTRIANLQKIFADGIIALCDTEKLGTGSVITITDASGLAEEFITVITGDITKDSLVNSRDIASMQRYISTGNIPEVKEDPCTAYSLDLNSDSAINSKDLASLQRIIAKGPEILNSNNIKVLADSPAISVKASKEVIAPGETVTITVLFKSLPVNNVSVLELVIPINTDAFSFVDGSATYSIEKTDNTIGDALYISEKNSFFCNYVDVLTPISQRTTTICSFQLTAKKNTNNVISTLNITNTSFLCDADLNNIPFTSDTATVSITSSNGLQLVSGSSYAIDTVNKYLISVPASTTASTVKSNFAQSGNLVIQKPSGTTIGSNDKVGTGYEISLYLGTSVIDKLTIIVKGDVTGDGLVNSRDIASLQRHIAAQTLLTGPFVSAGDLNSDDKLNSRDLASLQRLIATGQ